MSGRKRRPVNICEAIFAGVSVKVGDLNGQLYCFGLVMYGPSDGLWTRLVPAADGQYQVTLPRGKIIRSSLHFVVETQGASH